MEWNSLRDVSAEAGLVEEEGNVLEQGRIGIGELGEGRAVSEMSRGGEACSQSFRGRTLDL